jgi:hypothetical protein
MIAGEDRQLCPVLFVILRAFLITATQDIGDASIELWHRALKVAANLCERPL